MRNDELTRRIRFAIVSGALALGLPSVALCAATPGFGVAAAVHGDVSVLQADGSRVPLGSGQVVSPGDRIVTGPGAGLQVLLTDETVFTIGADADFSLAGYRYDPGTADGEVQARVQRGAWKVSSGRIGAAHPEALTIELPSGTVALRGTVVAGTAGEDGDTVALLGPGARRESLEKKGSFVFIPKGAAVGTGDGGILVYRSGFAVTIDAAGNVSEPFEMSGREFGQLVASLVGNREPGDDKGGLRPDGVSDDDPETGSEPFHGRKHRQRHGMDDDDYLARLDDDDYGDDDGYSEHSEEDRTYGNGRFGRDDDEFDDDPFPEGLPRTRLSDLSDVQGLKGRFARTGLAMEEGGTFDFRFEFGQTTPGELDYVGFENIQTSDVAGGELSWNVGVDGAPTFDRLDLRDDEGTLIGKLACVGVCEGRIRILNAGNGAVAKFYRLRLETDDDKFDERLVRPGGNNDFPQ